MAPILLQFNDAADLVATVAERRIHVRFHAIRLISRIKTLSDTMTFILNLRLRNELSRIFPFRFLRQNLGGLLIHLLITLHSALAYQGTSTMAPNLLHQQRPNWQAWVCNR
jgi:hypothetical protein